MFGLEHCKHHRTATVCCDTGLLNTLNLRLPVTRTVVGMVLGSTLWDLMIFTFPDILLISNNYVKEYTFDSSDSEQDG